MARNGSGTFSLPSGNPVVTGATISSTTHNATMVEVATALTDSLAKDGQTTPTANLPMGGYKHTGVASAAARTDYCTAGQAQDNTFDWLTSVSGADTITASAAIGMSAYAAGQTFRFAAAGANTGAVTLNVNAIGAKAVTKEGTTALDAGDIASGATVAVIYDGTRFQLAAGRSGLQPLDAELTALAGLTSAADTVPSFTGSGTAALITLGTASGNIPKVGTKSATELLAGLVELATTAEAAAGTDTDRAVTSAGVAAAITALAFDGSDYTRTAYTSPTRAKATNYTNSTGYPMFVTITMSDAAGGISLLIDGATIQAAGSGATSSNHVVGGIVLPGEVYRVNGNGTVAYWDEVAR